MVDSKVPRQCSQQLLMVTKSQTILMKQTCRTIFLLIETQGNETLTCKHVFHARLYARKPKNNHLPQFPTYPSRETI